MSNSNGFRLRKLLDVLGRRPATVDIGVAEVSICAVSRWLTDGGGLVAPGGVPWERPTKTWSGLR